MFRQIASQHGKTTYNSWSIGYAEIISVTTHPSIHPSIHTYIHTYIHNYICIYIYISSIISNQDQMTSIHHHQGGCHDLVTWYWLQYFTTIKLLGLPQEDQCLNDFHNNSIMIFEYLFQDRLTFSSFIYK